MAKKLLLLVLVLAAAGAGYHYWTNRASAPVPGPETARAPVPPKGGSAPSTSKPDLGHPAPGETVAKEQPFFEGDYGFSLVLPVGWKVVSWTTPAKPEPGQRRPPYRIRLEDPGSGCLLDFAVYPFTEKSRYAVEEIFISKIEPPVSGLELEIQRDEVVKQEEMRIRRAEMKTHDARGSAGMMKTYYYLANDKLYTFSLVGPEEIFASRGPAIAKILDDIRILG